MTISLATSQIMRTWDSWAIRLGVPELVLVENAARASLEILRQECRGLEQKNILVFMGAGNNGSDALCLARYLHELGLGFNSKVRVVHSRSLAGLKKSSKTSKVLIELTQSLGLEFISAQKFLTEQKSFKAQKNLPTQKNLPVQKSFIEQNSRVDIIIDGLLGTGFHGSLAKLESELIAYINNFSKQTYILSLDIPSGMDSLTGVVSENAVFADSTVSFEAAKVGLIFDEARAYCGKIFIRSIGIPKLIQKDIPASFELLAPVIASGKSPIKHKGDAGHVLVLGAAKGLVGAAKLAGLAAMRSGAGLVTIALPRLLSANLTDIMEYQLQGADEHLDAHSLDNLAQDLHYYSSVVLGVGLGKNPLSLAFIEQYLSIEERPPTVFDADALNLMALKPELLKKMSERDVLTPHPKEASRLLQMSVQEVIADRVGALKKMCALTSAVCLLKGVNTLLAQSESAICVSPANVPNLAVAGSGDVLSGVIAALLAQYSARKASFSVEANANVRANIGANIRENIGAELNAGFIVSEYSSLDLAKQGVLQHILAGLYLQKDYPNRGNLASDIANVLPFCSELDYLSAFEIDIK